MRKYRIRETRPNGLPPLVMTYEGFCKYKGGPKSTIATVVCDGDIEIWELDDYDDKVINAALESLREFYEHQGLAYNEPLVYRRVEENGMRKFVVARDIDGTVEIRQIESSDLDALALEIDPGIWELVDGKIGRTAWKAIVEYYGDRLSVKEIVNGELIQPKLKD